VFNDWETVSYKFGHINQKCILTKFSNDRIWNSIYDDLVMSLKQIFTLWVE